jgi:hypothetical protein
MRAGGIDSTHVMYGDEALFHLSAYANSQNNIYFSADNPTLINKAPLPFGVWCAISATRIIVSAFISLRP